MLQTTQTVICPNPNCGYSGPLKKTARGSAVVGLLLLFLFIVPGVLYLLFMQGWRYNCPKCGIRINV